MAIATQARRSLAWPRVVAWAWLPTLLLIVVTVLTVTPVLTADQHSSAQSPYA